MTTQSTEPGPSILPRLQAGRSTQHLLITLLGDFWFDTDELLPSAAIRRLLEDFGVNSTNARAALSRLARRGSLVVDKIGRNTYYGLSTDAKSRMHAGWNRIANFGSSNTPWDGLWTIAAFTLPEEQRNIRSTLRQRFRWLGLAPLFDGVWVSPRANLDDILEIYNQLDITSGTVFRANKIAGTMDIVSAWDLVNLRNDYEALIINASALSKNLDKGNVTATEALIARTALMDRWRSFPSRDPDLPADLLPADWPRHEAWKLFRKLYDDLGPLAELRTRQCIAQYDQSLADSITRRKLPTHEDFNQNDAC